MNIDLSNSPTWRLIKNQLSLGGEQFLRKLDKLLIQRLDRMESRIQRLEQREGGE